MFCSVLNGTKGKKSVLLKLNFEIFAALTGFDIVLQSDKRKGIHKCPLIIFLFHSQAVVVSLLQLFFLWWS